MSIHTPEQRVGAREGAAARESCLAPQSPAAAGLRAASRWLARRGALVPARRAGSRGRRALGVATDCGLGVPGVPAGGLFGRDQRRRGPRATVPPSLPAGPPCGPLRGRRPLPGARSFNLPHP